MSVLDRKLHRRMMLRWMGLTGAATMLPGLPLPARPMFRAIHESDLPALTAACPICYTDDDTDLLILIGLIFKRFGLTATGTLFSDEALDICRTQPVSLMISDIMKPDMDGFQVYRSLRADPVTRNIPFIFMSACSSYMERAIQSGAEDFITKPFTVQGMIDTIRGHLLRGGRWQRDVLAAQLLII